MPHCANTFGHVKNDIPAITRTTGIASGPLSHPLLAKPNQNCSVEVCHDLYHTITFEHVENYIFTIDRVRDIAFGQFRPTSGPPTVPTKLKIKNRASLVHAV